MQFKRDLMGVKPDYIGRCREQDVSPERHSGFREAPVPLFLCPVRTPAGLDPDEYGPTMPNIEIAYHEACASMTDMAIALVREGLNRADRPGLTGTERARIRPHPGETKRRVAT